MGLGFTWFLIEMLILIQLILTLTHCFFAGFPWVPKHGARTSLLNYMNSGDQCHSMAWLDEDGEANKIYNVLSLLGARKACPTGLNDFKWWLAHVSPKWDWKHHSASDVNQEM